MAVDEGESTGSGRRELFDRREKRFQFIGHRKPLAVPTISREATLKAALLFASAGDVSEKLNRIRVTAAKDVEPLRDVASVSDLHQAAGDVEDEVHAAYKTEAVHLRRPRLPGTLGRNELVPALRRNVEVLLDQSREPTARNAIGRRVEQQMQVLTRDAEQLRAVGDGDPMLVELVAESNTGVKHVN